MRDNPRVVSAAGSARQSAPRASGASSVARAWITLCVALALHVTDESLTGFLSVWNPTVSAIRARVPWSPLPTFGFTEWLGGLIVAILVLLSLSVFVYRGAKWIRPLAYGVAVLMIGNGLGHVAGTITGRTVASVQFARPAPGFYSSPVLIAASIWLLVQLRRTAQT